MRNLTRIVVSLLFTVTCLYSGSGQAQYVYNAGALSPGDTGLTLDSTDYGGIDSFDAVLRQGTGNPSVGVILLHGRGQQTRDGHVILPLRLDLSSRGYTTLSINTPAPLPPGSPNRFAYANFQNDAMIGGANYVFPELYSRIYAATFELQSRGVTEVVLMGFSMGSRLASAFLQYGNPAALPIPLVGYIGVGMGIDNSVSLLDTPTSLTGVTLPVLDLYGENDDLGVLLGAPDRLGAHDPSIYTQIQQAGAEHQWVGYESELIGHVSNWMSGVAPVAAVPEPEIYAMLGLGLGLMGWVGRRRKLKAAA